MSVNKGVWNAEGAIFAGKKMGKKKKNVSVAERVKGIVDEYFAGEQLGSDLAAMKGEARLKMLFKLSEMASARTNESDSAPSDALERMFRRIRERSDVPEAGPRGIEAIGPKVRPQSAI